MTLYDLFNHDILDESKAYVYIFKDNVLYTAGYYKILVDYMITRFFKKFISIMLVI